MNTQYRWTAVAFLVGFCAAYSLWGGSTAGGIENSSYFSGNSDPLSSHPNRQNGLPGNSGTPHLPNPTPGALSALHCKPFRINFGDIPLGEERSLSLDVENKSDHAITVLDIRSSCGCIRGTMPNFTVEAGKSAPLVVTFRAEQGRSANLLTLAIATNETGYPRVVLPVEGRTRVEFLTEPSVLNFGKLQKNERQTLTTKLISTDGKPFSINTVLHKNKEFSFSWKSLSEATDGSDKRSGYEITVTALGTRPVQWTETALVMVEHPRVKSVSFSVLLEIAPDVTFTPSNIKADQNEDKTVVPFETVVKRLTTGRLDIESVKDSVGLPLKYTTEQIDDASVRLKIQFSGIYPQRIPFGQFLVKTNTDEEPLPLPYQVRMLVPGKKQ